MIRPAPHVAFCTLFMALCGGTVSLAAKALPKQDSAPLERPSPERQILHGVVLTETGVPWPDAEVELLHRSHPQLLDARHLDIVRARSDDRGRFRAEVLPGREYGAWAWDSGETAWTYRTTSFTNGLFAGSVVRLRRRDAVMHRRRIQLSGADHWKHRLPLSFELLDTWTRPILQIKVPLQSDDTLLLPPTPTGFAKLLVRGRKGRVFAVLDLPSTAKAAAAFERVENPDPETLAKFEQELGQTVQMDLGKPYPRAIRCVSRSTGKPIPGARLLWRPDTRILNLQRLATTDEHGVASFEFSESHRQLTGQKGPPGELIVQAAGFAELDRATWDLAPRPIEKQRARLAKGEVDAEMKLMTGSDLTGRLLLGESRALAHANLILYGSVRQDESTTRFGIAPRRLQTDEQGRFAVPGRDHRLVYRVTLLLDETLRSRLRKTLGLEAALGDEVLITSGLASRDRDLGDLDLSQWPRIDIQLRGADGRPARGLPVLWVDMDQRKDGGDIARFDPHHYPVRTRSDRNGCLTILTHEIQGTGLFCGDERGFVSHEIAAPASKRHHELELSLDPGLVTTGQVFGPRGDPLPNAHLSLITLRPNGASTRLCRQIAALLSVHALPLTKTRADNRGRFEITWPLRDVILDLGIYGEQRQSARMNIPFTKESDPAAFDIHIGHWR
jgi:hypothetical protein